MTTQRILLLSYIVLGLLVCLVMGQLVSSTFGAIPALGPYLHRQVVGTDEFWSKFLGFVIGGAAAVWCWVDQRVKVPATQVVEELQRVTWPTPGETRTAAFAVIICSLICAALLGLFDYGWGTITAHIYSTP